MALDIACGLRFLHTAKPNPILHLDLVSCDPCLLVAACVPLLGLVGCCLSLCSAAQAPLLCMVHPHMIASDIPVCLSRAGPKCSS